MDLSVDGGIGIEELGLGTCCEYNVHAFALVDADEVHCLGRHRELGRYIMPDADIKDIDAVRVSRRRGFEGSRILLSVLCVLRSTIYVL